MLGILHINTTHDDLNSIGILRQYGEIALGHFIDTGANAVLQYLDVFGREKSSGQDVVFPFAGDGASIFGGLVFDGDSFGEFELDIGIGRVHQIHAAVVFC